jgi:hypothetical protein
MTRNIKNFILLCFFAMPLHIINAQQIFHKENPAQYTFTYQQSNNIKLYYTNNILLDLSRSIPKRLEYTSFTMHYTEDLKLIKKDTNTYIIRYELKNLYCDGDVFYRSFNISDILVPALSDFKLEIYRKNQQSQGGMARRNLIRSDFYENMELHSNLGYYKVLEITFTDTINDLFYEIETKDIQFYHSKNVLEDFQQRQNLVSIYYESDPLMEDMMSKLISFDFSNIDKLPYYDIKLKEIEQTLAELDAYALPLNLSLAQNDPIQFLPKFQEISSTCHRKRTEINQLLANLDQIFHQKGMDFLIMGKIEIAVEYFNKAIQVNAFFAPSHYQIAKLDFNNGAIDAAAERVTSSLGTMNPDPNTHNLLIDLAKAIYQQYFAYGTKAIEEKKFSEANETLEKAKSFCTSTSGIFCEDKLEKAIAQAKYGIFQSYLSVVYKALDNNKLKMAENYTEEARKYQIENAAYIISQSEIQQAFRDITEKYAQVAAALNKEENYDKALEQISEAEIICARELENTPPKSLEEQKSIALSGKYKQMINKTQSAYDKENFKEAESILNQAIAFREANKAYISTSLKEKELMPAIQYEFYTDFIHQGEEHFYNENYQQALDLFVQAENLSNNFVFKKYDSLPYFIKQAAKPIVLEDIKKGEMKVWGNNLEEARAIYQQCVDKQELYLLTQNSEVNTALEALAEKIFSQECTNAQNAFDKAVENARLKIQELDFIQAESDLNSARKISIDNTSCNIKDQVVTDILLRIHPAIQYQKLIIEVEEDIKRNSFASAHEKNRQAGEYFKKQKIENLGLEHNKFTEIALKYNNNNLIAYCCDFSIKNKDFKKAFELLSILEKRSYPRNYSRDYQEKIGTQLAIIDYEENPQGNFKLNIMKYTAGNKWYKYFSKTYKKTWKKIRK